VFFGLGGEMKKIDLRTDFKHLYAPSARQVEIVDVPRFNFALLDGRIEAGREPATSPAFQEALQALYGISFTLKFMSKLRKQDPIDYKIMALEGLWWSELGEIDFDQQGDWKWTLMMMQPDHISLAMFREAVSSLRTKRGDNPLLSEMRFEPFEEGLCMQIMHVGTYDLESMTIARMHDFAHDNGYKLRGKHHEIYIGDPRRAKPDRLRTILRHPIERNV
jgi:hypothetical protein